MIPNQDNAAASNELAWKQYYAAQAQQQQQQQQPQSWSAQPSDASWHQQVRPSKTAPNLLDMQQHQPQQTWTAPANSQQGNTPQPVQQIHPPDGGPHGLFNANLQQPSTAQDSSWDAASRLQPALPPPLPLSTPDEGPEAPALPPLPPPDEPPAPPENCPPPPPPPLPPLPGSESLVIPQADSRVAAAAVLESRDNDQPTSGHPDSWQHQQQQMAGHLLSKEQPQSNATSTQPEWTPQQIAEWHQQNQQQQYWQQQQQQQNAALWQQQQSQQYWQQAQWAGYAALQPQAYSLAQATHHTGGYSAAASWSNPSNTGLNAEPQPADALVLSTTSEASVGLQSNHRQPEAPPPAVSAASLFYAPRRSQRPTRIAVLLRGPPGSGKSTAARKIREAELAAGGEAPRTHTIDDYFFTDVEKEVDDEKRKGRKKKITVVEYEYDAEMEDAYEESLVKAFARTVREGKSRVVVVDAPLLKAATVHELWRLGQGASYEVFVAGTLETDPEVCHARNVHGRTLEDVRKAAAALEPPLPAFLHLDMSSLFEDSSVAVGNATSDLPPLEDNNSMDIEAPFMSAEASVPLPAANGSGGHRTEHDSDDDDGRSDGSVSPPATAKSRWADLDDDAAPEEQSERHSGSKRRRTSEASVAEDAEAIFYPMSPAHSPVVEAPYAKRLRGILTSGGSNGSNNRVKWPDQEHGRDLSDGSFVLGGSTEQLETIWVLEGLGPPSDRKQHDSSGHPTSFEDMVKGDHVAENKAFHQQRLSMRRK